MKLAVCNFYYGKFSLQFEARFAAAGRDKRPMIDKSDKNVKRRRKDSKKIWISELRVCFAFYIFCVFISFPFYHFFSKLFFFKSKKFKNLNQKLYCTYN